MKILFVLDNYFPYIGGAETLFKKLAEESAKKGNEVKVICPRSISTSAKYEILNEVSIIRLDIDNRYLYTFLSLPTIIKEAKWADVVHTTTYNSAPAAWIASKLSGKKVIITVHEILGKLWWKKMDYLSGSFHWIFEKTILKLHFDKFISVSIYTKKCLLENKIPEEQISVIYHGIDHKLFNPKIADGSEIRQSLQLKNNFVYLFYGRPGITKGLEYLIQAVPRIKEKVPDSKLLLLLGKKPENRYKYICNLIGKLGLDNDIIMHDSVSIQELPNYISVADCVVIPSLSEGFGFCAAESCALKKPVIVSKAGSLPEVVSGKVVWVEPADEKSLAEGIISFHQGKFAEIPERKFFWEDAINKYVEIYSKI
ncbi:MAG: glycosyltransferase family 4 protein [Candidatus Cloacimonetes bacterium]|nr:glycosyltransferase family 4 protein [Candidatus Cloacimonadota bacterium]